jgi:hypothetical protein
MGLSIGLSTGPSIGTYMLKQGILKREDIPVPLTSCLIGLKSAE